MSACRYEGPATCALAVAEERRAQAPASWRYPARIAALAKCRGLLPGRAAIPAHAAGRYPVDPLRLAPNCAAVGADARFGPANPAVSCALADRLGPLRRPDCPLGRQRSLRWWGRRVC